MEGPGMSLFQGGASIKLNNSAEERLEVAEQLADEKRRREELDGLLENAFDEFDDDDGSVNNSTCLTSINVTKPHTDSNGEVLKNLAAELAELRGQDNARIVLNGHNHQYVTHQDIQNHSLYDSKPSVEIENLKLMYEMRAKECQQLADRIQLIEDGNTAECNSLRARLELATTERERAELSLQQAQHALANAKHTILGLESRVSELSSHIDLKERDYNNLKLELHATSESLREAQRLMQGQQHRAYDTDVLFREQHDRHREEVDRLHEDLEKTRQRLSEKENEVLKLENRCAEVERNRDEMLIAKTGHINRLANELEMAQNGIKSKEKLSQVLSERNTAWEQVKELGSKLEKTARDLAIARDELKSWNQLLSFESTNSELSNSSPSNKIKSLKQQLMQMKQIKQQLQHMNNEIAKRDEKIETLKKSEQMLRSKIEDLTSTELHLNSKLAILQNKVDLLSGTGLNNEELVEENEKLKNDLDNVKQCLIEAESKLFETEQELEKMKAQNAKRKSIDHDANRELRNELETLSSKHKQVLEENGQLKHLYLQVCKTKDSLNREKAEAQKRINELLEEMKEMKSKNNDVDVEILRNNYDDLQKKFDQKCDELNELLNNNEMQAKDKRVCEEHEKTIEALTAQIKQLNIQLDIQEENEKIIKDLRAKADSFEQYILERYKCLQSKCDKQTNTEADKACSLYEKPNYVDSGGGGDCEEEALIHKEAQMRQEIASQFAVQLKNVELRNREKIEIIEKQHSISMGGLKELLEKKLSEIETLKNLIIAEREKVTEMLNLRAQQMEAMVEENKKLRSEMQELKEKFVLYGEVRTQLERCQNKIVKLKTELESKNAELQSARTSSSSTVSELLHKMNENDSKVQKLEKELAEIKEKYRNAKKLVHGLKSYTVEKEKHMQNELKRIENQYETALGRLHNKLQNALTSREKQVSEKLSQAESEFDAKLSKLNKNR